jgi:hypothetical protein
MEFSRASGDPDRRPSTARTIPLERVGEPRFPVRTPRT